LGAALLALLLDVDIATSLNPGLLVTAAQASEIVAGEEGPALAASLNIRLPDPAPARAPADAKGPFSSWVVRNVMLVDGLGSPPRGPVSLHVVQDKLHSILGASAKVESAEFELDGTGMYALPGFIDSHAHIGTPTQGLAGPVTPPDYIFKLWLAHGITTCLLYTSPSPRDRTRSRMPSSA